MTSWKRNISLILAAVLLLSCAACGGAKASSMWLVKTEGSVSVTDGEGAAVALTDRLGLFSGYGVNTQAASYGWIDLDETKLTKMDENSDVEVRKEGKNLVLTVNRGSLFFNVTKPLAANETFEIRSSDMVTAIRGTCGWVEVPDPGHMNVFILEGTVQCSVGGVTGSVPAGQRAVLSASEGSVAVGPFSAADIPAFVSAETAGDRTLTAAVQALPGPEPAAAEPAPPEDGDRIVLSGTLNEYSYEETVALQGLDPNVPWADDGASYWIIVLDAPQTIEISAGGGPGLLSRETSLISVLDPSGLEAYAGQHITFSIDPQSSWWPSDVSLPMGAARANEIRVLS